MVTPIFCSHYGFDGLLTLEEPGKEKAGGPVSVFTLAKEAGLSEVILNDGRIDGLIQAYKTSTKLGIKLCYGVKIVVCADHRDKSELSRRTESKIAIFARNTQGYHDLVRIYSRGWTDGHYTFRGNSYGRIDWGLLCSFWTENLLLALPYFSGFLACNTLLFNHIVPQLPVTPWVFKEMACGLPFAQLLDEAVDRYVAANEAEVVPIKTVYYARQQDFKPYQIYRCVHARSSYGKPEIEHFASDAFSWQSFKELTAAPQPS